MSNKYILKSYDDVLTELDNEIKTKKAYSKKIVELEMLTESNTNFMQINYLGISTLFAFLVGFMFDKVTEISKSTTSEIGLAGLVILFMVGAIIYIAIGNNSNQNTYMANKQKLLILKQEEELLNKDRSTQTN